LAGLYGNVELGDGTVVRVRSWTDRKSGKRGIDVDVLNGTLGEGPSGPKLKALAFRQAGAGRPWRMWSVRLENSRPIPRRGGLSQGSGLGDQVAAVLAEKQSH